MGRHPAVVILQESQADSGQDRHLFTALQHLPNVWVIKVRLVWIAQLARASLRNLLAPAVLELPPVAGGLQPAYFSEQRNSVTFTGAQGAHE